MTPSMRQAWWLGSSERIWGKSRWNSGTFQPIGSANGVDDGHACKCQDRITVSEGASRIAVAECLLTRLTSPISSPKLLSLTSMAAVIRDSGNGSIGMVIDIHVFSRRDDPMEDEPNEAAALRVQCSSYKPYVYLISQARQARPLIGCSEDLGIANVGKALWKIWGGRQERWNGNSCESSTWNLEGLSGALAVPGGIYDVECLIGAQWLPSGPFG